MWTEFVQALDPGTLTAFLWAALILAIGMLIWDTIEVGRNDAVNLVNAVYGARIVSPRTAMWIAGFGVVLGAYLSSGVIETVRSGIFEPGDLEVLANPLQAALAIYLAVYIVDTVLLYGYSCFGMPVSTTACMVFELLGASLAIAGFGIVNWPTAGNVIIAIVCSILVSGVAGFIIQRAIRGAIGERADDLSRLLIHGGWAGGGMLAMLFYFMVTKGMGDVALVAWFNRSILDVWGPGPVVFGLWAGFAMLIHGLLLTLRERAARALFPSLAILGTVCMGFAFGQNDLANCAAPGLAAYTLIMNREHGVGDATGIDLKGWHLLVCGLLLLVGMATRNAHRVTSAAVSAGSMSHHVALYAPRWCLRLARRMLRLRPRVPTLAPSPLTPDTHEARDYDALRACVILGVSASVIAMASSLGMPVSTTYVAFVAVIATGAADRILQRGDADLKLARTIWVIFSWFAAAVIAAVAAGLVCHLIYTTGIVGLLVGLAVNLTVRVGLQRRGEAQERRVLEQARERMYPEEFTDYEG